MEVYKQASKNVILTPALAVISLPINLFYFLCKLQKFLYAPTNIHSYSHLLKK